jgi:hypothetical protein
MEEEVQRLCLNETQDMRKTFHGAFEELHTIRHRLVRGLQVSPEHLEGCKSVVLEDDQRGRVRG